MTDAVAQRNGIICKIHDFINRGYKIDTSVSSLLDLSEIELQMILIQLEEEHVRRHTVQLTSEALKLAVAMLLKLSDVV